MQADPPVQARPIERKTSREDIEDLMRPLRDKFTAVGLHDG